MKSVLVTGGSGFLGRFVIAELVRRGVKYIAPTHAACDLRDPSAINAYLDGVDTIIHLAAKVGGIGANRDNPGLFFHDNIVMGVNVLEAARKRGVKVVIVGTVCSYPKFTPVPFKESDLWNGYPEETNAPYGLAKRALYVMADSYHRQYGVKSSVVIPTNLYGPGDNFDTQTSHVIPAMIRRFAEAKKNGVHSVTMWGSGSASREFLYVEDAASAIVKAAELIDIPDPVNLGTGDEVTIRNLAHVVASTVGYDGEILWDASKPDGQPRRCLDTSKAEKLLGWNASTKLIDGLKKTVDWYAEKYQ